MIGIHQLLRLRISVLYFVKDWGLSGGKEVECTEGKNKAKNGVHFLSSLLDRVCFPVTPGVGIRNWWRILQSLWNIATKIIASRPASRCGSEKGGGPSVCSAKIENTEAVEHSGPGTDFDRGTVSRGSAKASLSCLTAVISGTGSKSSGGGRGWAEVFSDSG